MPGISAQEITRRGRLLETGQTTCYHVGDDGDREDGLDKAYYVLTVGGYAGTTDIQVAHYAAATISFTAPNTIADAAGGLAGWAVNDRMLIKGSTGNDGEVTVTGIGGAPANLTISAAANELAGAMISLYKVTAHSNNCVFDRRTGRMWSRYTSNGEAVGPNSNGTLVWYDAALRRSIYAGANTVSCIAGSNIFRIVGGAGLTQFHEGDIIECAGFANPVNNTPGFYVVSGADNGADYDILVDPGNLTLIAEGAVGDTIYLVCQSIFNYAAGARRGILAGYADWRIPNVFQLHSLETFEAPSSVPDAVAFPGWAGDIWTSTTRTTNIAAAYIVQVGDGQVTRPFKTIASYTAAVVRG